VRRILLLVALAVSVGLAGCGGGGGGGGGSGAAPTSGPPLTKAQYQAALKKIAADVSKSLSRTSSSKQVTKADVDRFVKAIRSFAQRIEAINPPQEVKALHVRLIGAMNDLADEFPKIADQLKRAKDATAAIAALFGAQAVQELAKLQQDFKAKGYTLNLSG